MFNYKKIISLLAFALLVATMLPMSSEARSVVPVPVGNLPDLYYKSASVNYDVKTGYTTVAYSIGNKGISIDKETRVAVYTCTGSSGCTLVMATDLDNDDIVYGAGTRISAQLPEWDSIKVVIDDQRLIKESNEWNNTRYSIHSIR